MSPLTYPGFPGFPGLWIQWFVWSSSPFYQIVLAICFQKCLRAFLNTSFHIVGMCGYAGWVLLPANTIRIVIVYSYLIHVYQIPSVMYCPFIIVTGQRMLISWTNYFVGPVIDVGELIRRHMRLLMFIDIQNVALLFLHVSVTMCIELQMLFAATLLLSVPFRRYPIEL